jgi:hypothetical protein
MAIHLGRLDQYYRGALQSQLPMRIVSPCLGRHIPLLRTKNSAYSNSFIYRDGHTTISDFHMVFRTLSKFTIDRQGNKHMGTQVERPLAQSRIDHTYVAAARLTLGKATSTIY